MAKIIVNISENNMLEWMHSVGYFLPETEVEMQRFEAIHNHVTHSVDVSQVNPTNIINGTWKPKTIILNGDTFLNEEISELRMAARNFKDIPQEILEKMKKNQSDNGSSDNI